MDDLTYENATPYTTIVKKDHTHFELYGTSYTVPTVTVSEVTDSYTFVYYATNESGTISIGEAAYEDCYIV